MAMIRIRLGDLKVILREEFRKHFEETRRSVAKERVVSREYEPKSETHGDRGLSARCEACEVYEECLESEDHSGCEKCPRHGDGLEEWLLDELDEMEKGDGEVSEKEYHAIPGIKKYAKHGKFDKSACIDDLKDKKKIMDPAALCRSAEITLTGKARPTRGKKA